MKKYMFVIPSLSKGGAERVVSVLASTLAQHTQVTVLRYFKTEADYPIDEKVNLITLSNGFEADYNKIGKLKRIKMMNKIFKQEKPDVIIPFLRHVNIQTYISVPQKYRKKIIFTIRNNPASDSIKLHDFMIKHINRTIVQNEDQKNYFTKESHKRIFVMPNPVNTSFFDVEYNKKSDKTIIVSVGRLNKQKNFPMLIDSAKNLSEKYDNLEFRIYGDGALYDELDAKIKENGLENTVFLMGRCSNLAEVYSETDIFAMTSDFEGMPNALMEAMAAGVASVSTDCPTGPSDIIENGENGLLVPVGDTKAMTEALDFMISNPEKRSEMALKGRETIKERYMPEKIVQRLIDICEK